MSSVVKELLNAYISAKSTVPAWFDFVLNPEKLNKHLKKENPDPSALSLIILFFDQVNKDKKVNEKLKEKKDEIVTETKHFKEEKAKILKKLALQTAAHLKWDLKVFEEGLPLAIQHQLLNEYVMTCNGHYNPPEPKNLDISKLHSHALSSYILYCRFAVKTSYKALFVTKKNKSKHIANLKPHVSRGQQKYEDSREMVNTLVQNQLMQAVPVLEKVIQEKQIFHLPTYQIIEKGQLCFKDCKNLGTVVTKDEIEAQVCFELGLVHFAHQFYQQAYDMFRRVKDQMQILKEKNQILENSSFCYIDENVLSGYLVASETIAKKTGAPGIPKRTVNVSIFEKIESLMAEPKINLESLIKLIKLNITKKEVSPAYIDQVEEKVFELFKNKSDLFGLKWLCIIYRYLNHAQCTPGVWMTPLNQSEVMKVKDIYNEVVVMNPMHKHHLKLFYELFNSRYNNVVDTGTDNLEMGELPVEEKGVSSVQKIISSCNPAQLNKHHLGVSRNERASLNNLIESVLDKFPPEYEQVKRDLHPRQGGERFLHQSKILHLAKALHCCQKLQHSDALAFLSSKMESKRFETDYFYQESLKIKLLRYEYQSKHENDNGDNLSEFQNAQTIASLVENCKSFLMESRNSNFTLSPNLVELSYAFLLNQSEYDFLESSNHRPRDNETIKVFDFVQRFSSVMRFIESHSSQAGNQVTKLWTHVNEILTSPAIKQLTWKREGKRNIWMTSLNDIRKKNGGTGLVGGDDTHKPNARRTISPLQLRKFIRFIRNPLALKVLMSILLRINKLKYSEGVFLMTNMESVNKLWPQYVTHDGISEISFNNLLLELSAHELTPASDKDFLRIVGDLNYNQSQYMQALKCYIMFGSSKTNFFTQISNIHLIYDDQMIEKMVKCLEQLKHYTQAAVMCQFFLKVDYTRAFNALQENRSRCDDAPSHYRHHVHDMELLEHAHYFHHESGESGRLKALTSTALSRLHLNTGNYPSVRNRVAKLKTVLFFQHLMNKHMRL